MTSFKSITIITIIKLLNCISAHYNNIILLLIANYKHITIIQLNRLETTNEFFSSDVKVSLSHVKLRKGSRGEKHKIPYFYCKVNP